MQPNYHSYILGQQPLDNLPFMKWANVDLETINGKRIIDISNDIQTLIKTERTTRQFLLNKALYYITTAVTIALVVVIVIALAGLISLNSNVVTGLVVSSALAGFFHNRHEINMINTRTTVHLTVTRNWTKERQLLAEWKENSLKNIKKLNKLNTQAKALFDSSEQDQKLLITQSIEKINSAKTKVTKNANLLTELPPLSRQFLFT